MIAIFSSVGIYFKESRTEAFSALIMGISLGNLTGPILGTFLYSRIGFAPAFLTMGVVLCIFERVIKKIVPEFLNRREEALEQKSLMTEDQEVSYRSIFFNPGSVLVLFVTFCL